VWEERERGEGGVGFSWEDVGDSAWIGGRGVDGCSGDVVMGVPGEDWGLVSFCLH